MEVLHEANPNPKPTMAMKLMINKRNNRIMYAEAGKELVDLLLSILTLPIGSIVKLALRNDPTASNSSITNLYNSVENLPNFLIKCDKSILLEPKVISTTYTSEILRIQAPLPPHPKTAEPPRYYVCGNNHSFGSTFLGAQGTHILSTQNGAVRCRCGNLVCREVILEDPAPESKPEPSAQTGYVENNSNFVITDDLSIIHVNSTTTIVNLWNKIGIRDPIELEERNITVGANEVMGLLKAAMFSNTALNDVFTTEQNNLPKSFSWIP